MPIEAGDAADVVFGFLVESFPTSDTRLVTRGVLSGSVPVAYNPHAVLRRGYMHVLANGGAAYETADGGQVYVRIANLMPGLPIGGIEALNSPDVVAIPRAFFQGRRDQAKTSKSNTTSKGLTMAHRVYLGDQGGPLLHRCLTNACRRISTQRRPTSLRLPAGSSATKPATSSARCWAMPAPISLGSWRRWTSAWQCRSRQ